MSLIELYFIHINPFLPLLHRPTFEGAVRNGLHHLDHMFGATLLLVCALGSHYSHDPRVFLENTNNSVYSCGWKWYAQVKIHRSDIHARASLYELQLYSVSTLLVVLFLVSYFSGCSAALDPVYETYIQVPRMLDPHWTWSTPGSRTRCSPEQTSHEDMDSRGRTMETGILVNYLSDYLLCMYLMFFRSAQGVIFH